jgi:hypothetical protein
VTEGFSFDNELEHLHMNPVRKGLVQQPEDGRWSNYHRFAWEKVAIAGSSIPVDP